MYIIMNIYIIVFAILSLIVYGGNSFSKCNNIKQELIFYDSSNFVNKFEGDQWVNIIDKNLSIINKDKDASSLNISVSFKFDKEFIRNNSNGIKIALSRYDGGKQEVIGEQKVLEPNLLSYIMNENCKITLDNVDDQDFLYNISYKVNHDDCSKENQDKITNIFDKNTPIKFTIS